MESYDYGSEVVAQTLEDLKAALCLRAQCLTNTCVFKYKIVKFYEPLIYALMTQ